MNRTTTDQANRARDELGVLDGVIDYADRMILEEGRLSKYASLRRYAYGKTVIISTEKQGELTFRLSSTAVVYPNVESGYATPHSPVGRLCAFLRPGDVGDSIRWGEYKVREIRLFDRFDGALFEPNVRNFLKMGVEAESLRQETSDLRTFLATSSLLSGVSTSDPPVAPDDAEIKSEESVQAVAPVEKTVVRTVAVETLNVIEDDEEERVRETDLEDDETESSVASRSKADYFGLSESFYVNRTREQDEVMSRSPIGPMFVEGVAGSGKTSAALGRTKMLCDFNAQSAPEESDFREIAGHSMAYWSARFAGQFSQEGSIGFVRTGELIQYLKETCRRLDLPHLPVQEYPELRSRLRQHRRIERSKPGAGVWAGLPEPRRTRADTTVEWLRGADRALGIYWGKKLVENIPTVERMTVSFSADHRARARRVAEVAVARLRGAVTQLSQDLSRTPSGEAFVLDRLALRVQGCIQQVRKSVLAKEVLWVAIGETNWVAQTEQDMASQLVAAKVELFRRNGSRIVFLDDNGPVDKTLKMLDSDGNHVPWFEGTRGLLEKGNLRVIDSSDRTFLASASNTDDLYFRLLPESTERLYVLRQGALRPLNLQRSLGKERLEVVSTASGAPEESAQAEDFDGAQDTSEESTRRRSVDAVFSEAARRALLVPLTWWADSYAEALAMSPSSFPNSKAVAHITQQLLSRKLADEDVDLLLCLAHLVGRGFLNAPSALSEPVHYQSVFVDEVQDFTEQQIYLMTQQANPEHRAVTVVGDLAQKLHSNSPVDVPACFPGESMQRVQLTENLRQMDAPGLAWFSACFRAELQDGLTGLRPSPALRKRMLEHANNLQGPDLMLVRNEAELVIEVVNALDRVSAQQTAAVVLPNEAAAARLYGLSKSRLSSRMIDAEVSQRIDLSRRHIRHFTSVENAKGLEFDVVVLPNLEAYRLEDSLDVNRLYVALTRPRFRLVLLSGTRKPKSRFDAVWMRFDQSLAALKLSDLAVGKPA